MSLVRGILGGLLASVLRGIRAPFGATLVVAWPDGLDSVGHARWMDALSYACSDPRIRSVFVDLDRLPADWHRLTLLRERLVALRASGRTIRAWGQGLSNGSLYVGSVADTLELGPVAEVFATGIGTEMRFFGDALRRAGIEADFHAAGEYKSFGEPFRRTYPSGPNREAMMRLLGSRQEVLVSAVAASRKIDPSVVERAMSRAPIPGSEAVELGLVDRLCSRLEVDRDVTRKVPLARYAGLVGLAERVRERSSLLPKLAVVHLEGNIVDRASGSGPSISPERVLPVLEAVRNDRTVHAVVLHIDSPGGSAVASDRIWQSVKELAEEIPVIAHMGSVAASGGYYIACGAPWIVAEASTLTGSIGVFGGKPVVRGLQRKLGVNTVSLEAGGDPSFFSLSQAFTTDQAKRFQAFLGRAYDTFVERVAMGRKRPVRVVEPHCRGRVWTSQDAEERGLVDEIGGLDRAVQLAAQRAGASLLPVHIPTHPRPSPVQRVIARRFGFGTVAQLAQAEATLRFFKEHAGAALAMLPYSLVSPQTRR